MKKEFWRKAPQCAKCVYHCPEGTRPDSIDPTTVWKEACHWGSCEGVVKLIVRIVHLIYPEHLFQASFVEGAIVGHKRQPINHRGYLLPHIRKHRSVFRVLFRQPVNLPTEPLIVFRFRMDQAVERIHNPAIPDDYHSNTAHA